MGKVWKWATLFTTAAQYVKLKRTSESLNKQRVCRSLRSNAVLLGMGAHANNIPLSYKIKAGYEHHPSRWQGRDSLQRRQPVQIASGYAQSSTEIGVKAKAVRSVGK